MSVNKDKCTGCGLCVDVCPHAVFKIEEKKASIVQRKYCMECGACKMNCAFGAIEVESGVGCAAAVIGSLFSGNKNPECGCSDKGGGCC